MYEGARKHSFFALGYYYATREEEKKDYVKMCCFNINICYTRLYGEDYNGYYLNHHGSTV
jgi:hypothetical protein|tara:strand:+ start:284 stop:463 length:180 start_codon:yes stop_codon:yes gene_type:complete